MFHFPALPHAALCIQAAATPHDGGQVSPFGNPRITAWLPAPRGISQAPASFIGSWCQGIHRVPSELGNTHALYALHPAENRRCSRPLCSSQETGGNQNPETHPHPRETGPRGPRHQTAPVPSGPNSVPAPATPGSARSANREPGSVLTAPPKEAGTNSQCSTMSKWAPGRTSGGRRCQVLLRKEVIQPHLPVRLPCYDFVPIASPTFDGSLPYGLGRRLRVLPTFVT
jgi:hypothetical protein